MRVNIHKNCELLNFLPFSGFVQNITVYIPKLFKQNKKKNRFKKASQSFAVLLNANTNKIGNILFMQYTPLSKFKNVKVKGTYTFFDVLNRKIFKSLNEKKKLTKMSGLFLKIR